MRKICLSHTVWDYKCHIVWVPKKRRKVVYGKLMEEIGTVLRQLREDKDADMVEGKACIDHIHVCLYLTSNPHNFSSQILRQTHAVKM